MVRRAKIAATVGVFWFSLGGSLVAQAATPADACPLLTTAQVSSVLGVAVDAGKPLGAADCQWGAGFGGKGVLLGIVGPIGRLTPVDRFNTAKTPVPRIVKTPASGVGDDAVYVQTGGVALYVRKGNFVFQIRVSGFPIEESKTKETALAQEVLARL